MAKQQPRQKRANSKHVHAAALIKKDEKRQLIKLGVVVVCGAIIWAIYTFVLRNMLPNQQFDSYVVYFIALCVVILVGEVGNKYARYRADYRKAKEEWGVTDEEVKDHLAKM